MMEATCGNGYAPVWGSLVMMMMNVSVNRLAGKKVAIGYTYEESSTAGIEHKDDDDDDDDSSDEDIDLGWFSPCTPVCF